MSLTTSATSLESLKSAIDAGIESWKAAGIAIVDLIDNHGMTLGQISESINSPVVNPNVLAQFERIGRNQVLPRLLVASFPAAKAMQKLPLSEQRRLLDQGTDVMVMRTGGADTIIIRELIGRQIEATSDEELITQIRILFSYFQMVPTLVHNPSSEIRALVQGRIAYLQSDPKFANFIHLLLEIKESWSD